LDDVFRILIHALPGFGQRQPAMGAVKELHAQRIFEQIDLLDDGGRGNKRFFGGFAETARVGDAQKCFQLRIDHMHALLSEIF
jgi:hypothetical protein